MLANPAQEARAREIGQELRCLVCRNQSIDDSDADLAHDLRVLVRERITAGDTNDQVIAYIRSRYGDFVLLRPPFEIGTVLLWLGPLLILLLGGFGVARYYRTRGRAGASDAAALTPEERRRLAGGSRRGNMSIAVAIGLVGLTSLAVGLLLLPLLARHHAPRSREAYNLAVYRDQLAEIERDVARGVVTAEQAETARTEVGRRILALDGGETPPPVNPKPLMAAVAAILAMPVAALLIYTAIGSPGLPDQPFGERAGGEAGGAADSAPQMSMQEALTKLRAHLKSKPDDLTGWLLLARSEVGLGRYQEGAEAYARAAELSSNRPDVAAEWGEAQVLAAGSVTPAALKAFEAGLKDKASAPKSRYYLALAKLEQGDRRGALSDWADLAADSPPDAAWQPLLRQRIAEVAQAEGIDPASISPSTATTGNAAPPRTAATGMPSRETVAATVKATEGASPEERRAMIESMVARLASRLERQPEDAEGWARLGRSYMVLQQPRRRATPTPAPLSSGRECGACPGLVRGDKRSGRRSSATINGNGRAC